MAESIEKTQALDDLAQFAAGIDGALEAGTVDSLCQVKRVLGIHRNELFAQGDQAVTIGERLRALRKEKKLSQRDIAKKPALLRCNLWRLEIGRQVPTIETLEKMARALEIPIYQHFYDDEKTPKLPNLPKRKSAKDIEWRNSSKAAHLLAMFCRLFARMKERDLGLVLFMEQKMTRRKVV